MKILDSSKLKEFAEDNFKFDENDRMFSKQTENTVVKGEIAHYEQFLLFPQCFQTSFTGTKEARHCRSGSECTSYTGHINYKS